jgi:hypothetical protein
MWLILKSIFLTFCVAGIISTLAWTVGYDPIKAGVFALVGQYIFFYIFNTILQSRAALKNKELENERIKEFSKQGTVVPCAYCGEDNLAPIRFDVDNKFACNTCGKINSVYINITTAQVTNPLEANPLAVQAYIADREEAIQKIRNSEPIERA